MKNYLLLLLLLGISIAFTNCSDDEDEDLTIELVGEYIGGYGSIPFGEINPYEIVVSKIDNKKVSVKPKSGNEFEETNFDLERSNSSTIISPPVSQQQLEKSVVFSLSTPTTITFSIDLTGDAHAFTGQKQ